MSGPKSYSCFQVSAVWDCQSARDRKADTVFVPIPVCSDSACKAANVVLLYVHLGGEVPREEGAEPRIQPAVSLRVGAQARRQPEDDQLDATAQGLAPAPRFFVRQRDALDAAHQIRQRRVEQQVFQRLAVSRADQLNAALGNGARRLRFEFAPNFVNDDDFGVVVLDRLDHHLVLQ